MSYLFAFSYCSWGSQGKNTEVVCHSLLQWTTFWTAKRSNQFILKEISPEYSLEGLMLKLKLQYFGHLMQRTDSFEKTLMPGKMEGGRRRGQQRVSGWNASSTQWTWVWVNCRSWWWTGRPDMLQSVGSQKVGQDWATELNSCSSCTSDPLRHHPFKDVFSDQHV